MASKDFQHKNLFTAYLKATDNLEFILVCMNLGQSGNLEPAQKHEIWSNVFLNDLLSIVQSKLLLNSPLTCLQVVFQAPEIPLQLIPGPLNYSQASDNPDLAPNIAFMVLNVFWKAKITFIQVFQHQPSFNTHLKAQLTPLKLIAGSLWYFVSL